MVGPFDLTGTWRGYYEQAGRRHGIVLLVAQKGAAIVGRMRDEDTLLMHGVQVDDGGGEATAVTQLPENAIVEGDVRGNGVRFTKRYQGSQKTHFWRDGRSGARLEIRGHTVQYIGVIDQGGDVLRGVWRVTPREQGPFELRREQARA